MKLLIKLALLMAITSCSAQAEYSDEAMYDLASILKDVAQAVDGEIKFGEINNLADEQIIANAMSSAPDKLAKLNEYQMILDIQGDHAVMLLCDGDVALMEDAGCNAAFDNRYWHQPQHNTCKVSLNASSVCTE
ncbi:hypothetical protein L6J37_19975 [Photobacterium sp. WH77]|uniref:Lipoprotein n=1 Tax=Photobacterium arenosum TaxID=2774143 RepID=A0ABR9BFN2_9GAMM|nr:MULTISPECIES: hypothetical protein [Photobacterium]MBD8511368.1 hypothetical protein [Photobacterium arenosum]MBV7263026.1 hypothetical protein [Photobacterium sp. WH24]MCG2839116.1 hypothetical protein [Photobacterium sp. WH77]MCG2846741.1 hypothetical protein [Photobacterium sp. WH80]MDO6582163.1 hypothetical protein [Photobacterium sp. 2_MG-2023]